MPNLTKQIEATMRKLQIPDETIAKFVFPENNQPEGIMALIAQMDELLPIEQRLAVMQEQGCCVTGKPAAAHTAFGRKHAGKSLEEKIRLLGESDIVHNPPCKLNADGTLSVFWSFENDGEYKCVCGFVRKLAVPTVVSPTFCGCCGGHVRKNLQRSLGVKLRLVNIVSSAASTGGKRRCEFLYDISGK